MRARPAAAGVALLAGLALAACERSASPAGARPPNVVLITIDTLRADHLGTYGYFRDTSPNIDRLAGQSIVFERCLVPAAVTLPSHLSLLTSTHPLEHGVLGNIKQGAEGFAVSERLKSFASSVGEHGYARAAFVSATPLKPWSGIDRGFEHFDAPAGHTRSADRTTAAAIAWLDARPRDPFFLWVHYFDPHSPYAPPSGFSSPFVADAALDAFLSQRRVPPVAYTYKHEPVATREEANAYDGEILFTDREVGRLVEALRRHDLLESSALVLVGDHGEGIGQHDVVHHGDVWDEQLRVPLLMRVPGQAPRRVAKLMSILDVFPTLLAMVEIPGAQAYLEQASGRDVFGPGTDDRRLLAQNSLGWEQAGFDVVFSLTGERWKYIRSQGGDERLFDRTRDPHELHDVSALHPDVAGRFAAEIVRRRAQLEERGRHLRAGRGEPLDPAVVEELRALGYVRDP